MLLNIFIGNLLSWLVAGVYISFRSEDMGLSVLFYVPNLIGYLRVILLVCCWVFFEQFYICLPLYAVSAFLDGIDGCVARRLGQCSAYGAWLDVLVDNIGRTIMWTKLYEWGVFVVCLEWTVFVCTHTLGSTWKRAFGAAPWWVKQVMDNGFYTPTGVFTVAGIHFLPIYLYFWQHYPKSWIPLRSVRLLLLVPVVILVLGRLLGLLVELWCIKVHILHMLTLEDDKNVRSLTQDLDRQESPS